MGGYHDIRIELFLLGGVMTLASFLSAGAWGQEFDAASVKPAPDPESVIAAGKIAHVGTTIDGARVDIGSATLKELIAMAYKLNAYQIQAPAWMDSHPQRFDVLAAIPPGQTKEHVPEMTQALLAERFHLVVHRESKEQPVYSLVVGKSGAKLTTAVPEAEQTTGVPIKVSFANGALHYEFSGTTMHSLAAFLSQGHVGMQVIDRTGLSGDWQVALDIGGFRPVAPQVTSGADNRGDQGQPASGASDPLDDMIVTSLRRLGLNLEKSKATLEQLVVDHADKMPTED